MSVDGAMNLRPTAEATAITQGADLSRRCPGGDDRHHVGRRFIAPLSRPRPPPSRRAQIYRAIVPAEATAIT